MKTVTLGNAEQRVSEFALGTMYMGSRQDERQSELLLETYLELGGNFIDTANNYAHWVDGCEGTESESFLGSWFEKTRGRQRVFLATKVGFDKHGIGRGLKRKQIIENCEKSLSLLKTDWIDLYYAHTDDRFTPLEESLEAFDTLFRQGKIRFLGASNYVSWRYLDALDISLNNNLIPFACLQNKFTYLCPSPAEHDSSHIAIDDALIDFAHAHRFPLLAYSPLMRGFYADAAKPLPAAYDHSYNRQRLEVLRRVTAEIDGATASQVVLAWMRTQKAVIIPIISGSTADQIRSNLAAADLRLTPEQVLSLDIAGSQKT